MVEKPPKCPRKASCQFISVIFLYGEDFAHMWHIQVLSSTFVEATFEYWHMEYSHKRLTVSDNTHIKFTRVNTLETTLSHTVALTYMRQPTHSTLSLGEVMSDSNCSILKWWAKLAYRLFWWYTRVYSVPSSKTCRLSKTWAPKALYRLTTMWSMLSKHLHQGYWVEHEYRRRMKSTQRWDL